MSLDTLRPDLVVLGAGATGLAAARAARTAGASVALVEAARPGGDCTHYGCVPSKALLESAHAVHTARRRDLGFSAALAVDFRSVMERVAAVVREVEEDESPARLADEGIGLVAGWGRFTGPDALAVETARGVRELRSDRFVVACGSRSVLPPVDGLADVPHLTNRTVFDLHEQPEHLLVLGGGPIGVELAQAFRRLGSAVTVVEAGPRVLPRDDPDASAVLAGVLAREGVDVRTGQAVASASVVGDGVALRLADGTVVEGSDLLVAAGRAPATDGVGLEAAGVRLDERGRVVTDGALRAAPTVWAAGDCTSRLQFTHVGDEQGRLAARNALAGGRFWRRGRWPDDPVVPWVTFTDPEVAHVGLTEDEARARHGDKVRVSVVRDTDGDRARTAGAVDGFVKLVAVPGPVGGMALGRLVGMTVVGPRAGEVVHEGVLAMRAGTLVGRLAQAVHAYPTWSLPVRIAAARFFGPFGGEPSRAAREAPPG